MWHAASGSDFVLTGKFKDLVSYVIDTVFENFFVRKQSDPAFLEDVFNEVETDPEDLFFMEWHEPFEPTSAKEKVMLIADVIRHMANPESAPPELLQYNESAVYAIFESLAVLITCEIDNQEAAREDGEDPYELRRLVSLVEKEYLQYTAVDENDAVIEEDAASGYIDYTDTDHEAWENLVDSLSMLILWDNDFLDAPLLDMSPEIANAAKEMLGVTNNYYSKIMPTPTKQEFYDAVSFLEEFRLQGTND